MGKKSTPDTTTKTTAARRPGARELDQALRTLEAAKLAQEKDARKKRWTAEGIPGQVWSALARPPKGSMRDLYRHTLTPWYWALPAAGAIAAQEALVVANDLGGAASLATVAAGSVATANVIPAWLRSKKAAKAHPHAAEWAARERGHTRLVANVGAAGAVAAHVVGLSVGWSPDVIATAGLVGLGAFTTAAARYWQWHRHNTVVLNPRAAKAARLAALRTRDTEQPKAEVADPDELVRRLNERWPKFVAASNRALPGAELTEIERTDYGSTAVLHLVPGAQEKATAEAAKGRIATALKLSPSAITFEDIEPEGGQEPDASIVRLRVVSQATSDRPVPLDDGRPRVVRRGQQLFVRLGSYIDHQGESEWMLYDGESAWGGFVAGKTGAGKTTILETLVIGALESGCTYVIYAKPRKGPSPRIAKYAHWTIEADAASRTALVDGVIKMMEMRGLINELNDTSNFVATPEYPGVLVIIDEFHEAGAQIEAAGKGRLNRISSEIRAVGGGLVGASQGFGLERFGQDDVLRGNMTATNSVSMKLGATQAGVFKREMGMSVNPGDLPDPAKHKRNKGLAFSLLGRPVPFRGAWAPEDETDRIMAAAKAKAVKGLDPDSEAALDAGSRGLYSGRHEQAARRKDQVRSMLAAMRQGLSGASTPRDSSEAGDRKVDHRREAAQAGRPVPPKLPRQVVIDIAQAREAAAAKAAPAPSGPRRSPAIEGVLEVLQTQGPTTTGALQKALEDRDGCTRGTIDSALKTLRTEGAIDKADASRKAPWTLI
ncbi:hypothetical protein [Nocardiopsis sp. L17-MgMaSL7]|uniref:hypothetical protein n=1 Tax=Nocardiopsis sp. L17-MgMaSL7 TaxID=1938893 RepID=UPI000D8458E0|nr:hypothetical protein [Nocardiopsis sp. L17-MgMaSL7]PWV44563.1 hypothetical protein BDW27_12322 [Nocardiopsis sp. L17-MgMaSL7]